LACIDLGSILIIRVSIDTRICVASEEPEMSPPKIIELVRRDRDRIYIWIPLRTSIYVRVEVIRDGASEVQGLLLLILMDVVELVPSISFSPRMNIYGRMSDRACPDNHVFWFLQTYIKPCIDYKSLLLIYMTFIWILIIVYDLNGPRRGNEYY